MQDQRCESTIWSKIRFGDASVNSKVLPGRHAVAAHQSFIEYCPTVVCTVLAQRLSLTLSSDR